MDGVNEPDENGKISNLFGRKSQNWPNLRDENCILLNLEKKYIYKKFRLKVKRK
ncbi:hypothetical protein Hanom_Chr12g01152621 [Helianthus anomalus]